MELVVGGLFLAGIVGFSRVHTHIDSQASRAQAQEEYKQQQRFVRDIVSQMDREAVVREHVSTISRDLALGNEATYEGDRAVVAQWMRELQKKESESKL